MTGKYGITASLAVLVLYCGEIYPTNLRNEGLGLASTAGRIGGMLAPFTVYLVRSCLVLGVTRIWDTYDYAIYMWAIMVSIKGYSQDSVPFRYHTLIWICPSVCASVCPFHIYSVVYDRIATNCIVIIL